MQKLCEKLRAFLNVLISFIYPESEATLEFRRYNPEQVYGLIPSVTDKSGLIDRDIHAVWQYRHKLAEAVILQIKGSRDAHAAGCAGFAVYRYILNLEKSDSWLHTSRLNQPILLIPIPLSRKRQNERGYNQCELIVKAILETAKANHSNKSKFEMASNILIRQKHSSEQKTKNRSERIKSSADIFNLKNPSTVVGRTCVVIDDVATTGSTLIAARKILLEAGATQVKLIAIAH